MLSIKLLYMSPLYNFKKRLQNYRNSCPLVARKFTVRLRYINKVIHTKILLCTFTQVTFLIIQFFYPSNILYTVEIIIVW
jgi:hypothetical protein